MEYCVAIRTLGTAGEKYQTLLESLDRQTIKPKKIFVYIPYGYEIPKETIGWEEYIRCPKGMMTQRSLSFDEIDTDYILFCDDDLWLADDFVEKSYKDLCIKKADCIAPDIFKIQESSFFEKFKIAISGYCFTRKNDGWAFKIMRNGSYTYNNHPSDVVLPSESAAGACVLIKKKTYQKIHFEDECWLEDFGYPLGEDLLFFHKLFIMGFRVYVHYGLNIKHLDAGVGSKSIPKNWIRKNAAISVAIPYRIKYLLNDLSIFEKMKVIISCSMKFVEQFLFLTIKYLVKYRRLVSLEYLKGIIDGYRYVHSEHFLSKPKFDAYKR